MTNCVVCQFHRGISSRLRGVKIPDGAGKCTRPGGHCNPDFVISKVGFDIVDRRHKKEQSIANTTFEEE